MVDLGRKKVNYVHLFLILYFTKTYLASAYRLSISFQLMTLKNALI